MNSDTSLLTQRRNAWNRYWQNGPLHCLSTSFEGNYQGAIGQFWADVFSGLKAGQRVLDIGTGNGALPALLLELQPRTRIEIDAVDLANLSPVWHAGLSEDARERLRFHGSVRAEALPFGDACFELAVSQYGIEYSDHRASIAELARTLTAGGQCAFVLHHTDSHLFAVARDEVLAATALLADDGLLRQAAHLFPYLALAAAGQLQQLRTDPKAANVRGDFNASAGALAELAEQLSSPDLLLEIRQQVFTLCDEILRGQRDPAQAEAEVDRLADDVNAARLRSEELCAHALDATAIAQFATQLTEAGFSEIAWAPLYHDAYLIGWTLRAQH